MKRLTFILMLCLTTFSATGADDIEEIRSDCTIEGQAAGLEGKDLLSYVEECVKSLSNLEFKTLAE